MAVRLPARWMNATDDRILEWLDSNHVASQSTYVNEGPFDYHRNTIGRRMRLLSKIDLLKEVHHGVYTITDDGRAYLRGELDLRAVDEPS